MAIIQKNSISTYVKKSLPNGLDVAYCATVVVIGLLVMLLPTMLSQYNLFGARGVLRSDIGEAFTKLLAKIDNFSFTDTVVTFLFWGVVGIFVYALVSAFTHVVEEAEEEYELMSEEYVHPSTMSRKNIWREKLVVGLLSFVSMLIFIAMVGAVLAVLLPIALIHLRAIIATGANLVDIAIALAAVVLLLIGACIVLVAFRLWQHRKILLEEVEA